ncbi:hypothetical protein M406DRAFT_345606 [Cryphonectria parasitica EP155]|uniref:N-acetyltransferase domain-containing protein n=1 Tax=Cryphonectria parasitica (strain ATCC 38755 / EP155) TaxID=660469 RepID=A0A9P4Y6C5_CRYP1|nr:uncharacterized protein M406DRAFT_345606 [Cryphonectria parasitica EP155]KAF3767752.1 hypothetical protein M406DRAFT_345606 [Cryphonectria parasitica EP155]
MATTTATTTTTTSYYPSTQCTHIELDLSACHLGPNSIADRINDVVPGLKTSTAFFHFLRANLALQPSSLSSNVSTPLLEPLAIPNNPAGPALSPSPLGRILTTTTSTPTTINTRRPASPRRQPPRRLDDDLSIPPLSLDILTSQSDKTAALALIADSIAQQRPRAAISLASHPLLLAGLALALALTYKLAWATRTILAVALAAGFVVAYLVAIHRATAGYSQLAQDLDDDFLTATTSSSSSSASADAAASGEDIVIGAHLGTKLVGACVLRLEPGPPTASSPRSRRNRHHPQSHRRGGRGVLRAWTVRTDCRGQGVGADLLREAVRTTRDRCGREAEVGFAAEHANSAVFLPEMFNRALRLGERRAAGALERVLGEWDGMRRKR